MIHVLALLTDLLTDEQCMRALAHDLFDSGVVNTAIIFLLGLFGALRRRKFHRTPAPSHA
jgi:hypothetical protein